MIDKKKNKAVELTDEQAAQAAGGLSFTVGMEITCPHCGYTDTYQVDTDSATLPPCRSCGKPQD